mmetsp:Transcript_3844/g.13670  ORF Transcript_3844/g.13670 Transcript_3844/m.13670 type:complete len:285 (+) Transcript_3844:221-1075(+)
MCHCNLQQSAGNYDKLVSIYCASLGNGIVGGCTMATRAAATYIFMEVLFNDSPVGPLTRPSLVTSSSSSGGEAGVSTVSVAVSASSAVSAASSSAAAVSSAVSASSAAASSTSSSSPPSASSTGSSSSSSSSMSSSSSSSSISSPSSRSSSSTVSGAVSASSIAFGSSSSTSGFSSSGTSRAQKSVQVVNTKMVAINSRAVAAIIMKKEKRKSLLTTLTFSESIRPPKVALAIKSSSFLSARKNQATKATTPHRVAKIPQATATVCTTSSILGQHLSMIPLGLM